MNLFADIADRSAEITNSELCLRLTWTESATTGEVVHDLTLLAKWGILRVLR